MNQSYLQRSKERISRAARQSPQAPDRHPNAAPDPNDPRTNHAATNYFGDHPYFTTSPPFAHTPPGGIVPVPSGISMQQFNAATAQLQQAMAFQGAEIVPIPEPLPTEIKPGEIIAWRAWRVEGKPGAVDGLCLRSMSVGTEWTPRMPMRGNIAQGDGVHAWKTKEQAVAYAGYSYTVFGEVELWGQVIEHEDGYRAEYGAIKSLHRPVRTPITERQLRALRVLYGLEEGKISTPSKFGGAKEVGLVAGASFLMACCGTLFAVTSSTVLVVMSAFAGILMLFAMLTAD